MFIMDETEQKLCEKIELCEISGFRLRLWYISQER